MNVGLFIPCYVDQLYPQVGMATVDVLNALGVQVDFPTGQTCCGQPMSNTGCVSEAEPLAKKFHDTFHSFSHVVCPSGSCVAMVRHHYEEFSGRIPGLSEVGQRTYELCEFLAKVLKIDRLEGHYPHKVGLHQSCHALRELRLARSSELTADSYNLVRQLLDSLDGIELSKLERDDECCGFGGTFAVTEEAVSCMMGQDRVDDHARAGSEVVTAVDMSCLMHLEGIIHRQRRTIRVLHIAELLADVFASSPAPRRFNRHLETDDARTE